MPRFASTQILCSRTALSKERSLAAWAKVLAFRPANVMGQNNSSANDAENGTSNGESTLKIGSEFEELRATRIPAKKQHLIMNGRGGVGATTTEHHSSQSSGCGENLSNSNKFKKKSK